MAIASRECAKCGREKAPDAGGRYICRDCNRANAARNGFAKMGQDVRAANCKARGARTTSAVSALEMFDALVLHCGFSDTVPSPRCVRLKAGESLYSRKAM